MNAGARANREKAEKVALVIARLRSEGLDYKSIGKLLDPPISAAAAKQRHYRHNLGKKLNGSS